IEHLCDLNAHDFIIKPRTSFIFTTEDEEDVDDETSNNIQQMNDSNITKSNKDSCKRAFSENIDEDDQEHLNANEDTTINCPSSRTEELLLSANTQQLFLANCFRQYLAALMRYEESQYRSQKMSKPLPFHIIVNGLAVSGKSYVISIIEQMLTDFCISESATRNRPRRGKGLLKMAHTGKAALNIHGWTIHTALGMKVGMARSLCFSPVQASKKECKIDLKPSDDENECVSMFEQLPIYIGARVICRRNIDFDGEMVNGTEAIIKGIIWDKDDDIVLPMSNRCVFPNLNRALTVKLPKYIELELDNGSIYKMTPEEVSFKDQNGIWMARKQCPLSLGYAITVHRSQCMTYNKLVVDLTGIHWKPGMFYPILSRTRRLTDIIILAYNLYSVSKPALNEMSRLNKIEEQYPIKIEQYLKNERYIEWCVPHSSDSNQISTRLSNTNNESISNCINTKQIQLQCMLPVTTYSVTKPEHVIICEEHEEHFCGRHALRALSQRLDLFTDKYLFDIAEDIAATDQIRQNGQPNILNVQLLRIDKLEDSSYAIRNLILSNVEHIQAFLIQQDYHYYCLRSFRSSKDYFFKIDSKHSMYHEPIRRERLFEYLAELVDSNCAIFIIMQDTVQNINQQITIDNIQKALWPLPDAPADFELFLRRNQLHI
ncbi:unnamed protein product, partial [Rotaria sp. Silwood1]